MKRSLIFLFILALAIVLSGCSKKSDSADDIEARKICSFKKIYQNVDVGIGVHDVIYVDCTTGVLYFRSYGTTGFTPLYNADGSLKIWDGYKNAIK